MAGESIGAPCGEGDAGGMAAGMVAAMNDAAMVTAMNLAALANPGVAPMEPTREAAD